ncbi:MAG: YfhO family protein [bacterium]|nr:YfhO family protein [bacterium]
MAGLYCLAMAHSWLLLPALVVVAALVQVVLVGLARGLGRRLSRGAMVAGVLVPLLFLAPWWSGRIALAPLGVLANQTPGVTERIETPHDVLNDTVHQFLPWEREVRRAWGEGRLPLWSDTLDGGSSPWVNPQAGVLSPIAMASRALPFEAFLLVTLFLKLMVAIEGCWLLCRVLGAGHRAALLGAVSFALGGGMIGWALFPHTRTAAWLPWMVAAAIVVARRPDRWSIAVTSLTTALVLLSGHPETAFAGGLLAAVCGLAMRRRRECRRRECRREVPFARSFRVLAVAAVLGFGLAAVQWVPFLEYLPHSQRLSGEALAGSRPVDLLRPGSWFIDGGPWALAAPFHPHTFGRPYEDGHRGPGNWAASAPLYSGLLVAAGVLVAASGRHRRRACWLLGFALVMLLMVIGPLDSLHHRLPVLHASNTSRYLLAAALALAVAAALGFDEMLRRARRGRFVALTGMAAVISLVVPVARGVTWSVPVALLWLSLLLAIGWRFSGGWHARGRWARWAVMILVVLLDLVPWGRRHLPRAPAMDLAANPALEELHRELAAAGPWRAVGEGYTSYPSVLPLYGIADARPHNPIAHGDQVAVLAAVFDFDPVTQYFAPFRNVGHPLLDFLNVRVIVSRGGGETLPPGLSRQRRANEITRFDGDRFGDWRFYRNADALPRFFLARRSEAVERRELFGRLRGLRDPRTVVLSADQVPNGPVRREWPEATVRLVKGNPGHVVLDVGGAGERLLATSLPHLSGWSARVGTQRLRRLRINGAFAGFQIGAGAREVELRFRPPGLGLGLGVTLISAVGLLLLIVSGARVRRAAIHTS